MSYICRKGEYLVPTLSKERCAMVIERTTAILLAITAVVVVAAFLAISASPDEAAAAGVSWRDYPLTDAMSGSSFTIGELAATQGPVLIQTYATWCPSCALQLAEMKTLQD